MKRLLQLFVFLFGFFQDSGSLRLPAYATAADARSPDCFAGANTIRATPMMMRAATPSSPALKSGTFADFFQESLLRRHKKFPVFPFLSGLFDTSHYFRS